MHILHITDGIYPISLGGMQKYAAEWTKAVLEVDEKLLITLVFTDYERQYSSSDEKKLRDNLGHTQRLKLIYVPFPKNKPQLPLHYISESKAWSRSIFEAVGEPSQYDVIYAHGFSGVSKPKEWEIPMVVNLHGLNMFQKVFGWKNKLVAYFLRKLATQTLAAANGAISLGGKLTPLMRKVFKGELIEIPVGINANWIGAQPRKKNERPVFLFVGRPDPVKGLDLFLNASQHFKEADFWVVGCEGTNTANVRYFGPVFEEEKLMNIFDQVDYYVSCGYSEGMPIAILEAFARAVPVIASNVGATTSLVGTETGWCFETGNQEQLDQAVKNALENKEYEFKSNEALKQAKNYHWKKVAEEHLSFFDSLS